MFAVINHLHLSKPVAEFRSRARTGGTGPSWRAARFPRFLLLFKRPEDPVVIILWASAGERQMALKRLARPGLPNRSRLTWPANSSEAWGRLLFNTRSSLVSQDSWVVPKSQIWGGSIWGCCPIRHLGMPHSSLRLAVAQHVQP